MFVLRKYQYHLNCLVRNRKFLKCSSTTNLRCTRRRIVYDSMLVHDSMLHSFQGINACLCYAESRGICLDGRRSQWRARVPCRSERLAVPCAGWKYAIHHVMKVCHTSCDFSFFLLLLHACTRDVSVDTSSYIYDAKLTSPYYCDIYIHTYCDFACADITMVFFGSSFQ
jgi:hypothetical protein